MRIKRGDLFDAVWQSPRKKLAEEWNTTSGTITSACRRHEVPLPVAGYWTQVAMGKPVERPCLTGTRETLIHLAETVTPSRKQVQPEHTTESPEKPDSKTTSTTMDDSGPGAGPTKPSLRKTISGALPAVRKAYRSYSSPKADRDFRYRHVLPSSDSIVRIAVMPEMVERTLLIMDAILRAFAVKRWAVKMPADKDRTKNSVEIDGVTILFTITEQRKQERIKSDRTWTDWEYRYHSTGILRFQYGAGTCIQEIKDTKSRQLEERTEDIIQALHDEVTRVKDAETKRQEQEHLHRLGQMLSGLVQDAVKNTEQCEQRLVAYLARYAQAKKIRAFVDDIKRRTRSGQLNGEQIKWIEWALRRADELDPVTQFDQLDHTVPETVLGQVQAMIAANPERYAQLNELDLERSVELKIDWMKRFPKNSLGS